MVPPIHLAFDLESKGTSGALAGRTSFVNLCRWLSPHPIATMPNLANTVEPGSVYAPDAHPFFGDGQIAKVAISTKAHPMAQTSNASPIQYLS